MGVQTTYGTHQSIAFAGMLADSSDDHDIKPMINREVSAEIAFGRAVKFGSTTDETSALLPDSENAKIAGILCHSHGYTHGYTGADLGDIGLKPGSVMNVLRKGRVWVIVEDDTLIGDRLWVRGQADGDPEFLGGLCVADDSTDTVDCTNQGVFVSAASAGGLAILEVDFTNKPGI